MEFRMSYKILKVQFSRILNDKTSLDIQKNFERLTGKLEKILKFYRTWNMQ